MTDIFVKVARIEDIKPGKMRCVGVEGRRILLANVAGRIFASDDTCTHEEASLSAGSLKGEWVKCPLHNSRFNVRTGKVAEEPATEDLATYPVRIEGRDILVGLKQA